jgi:BolA family transcriptional regulator, general stress-responsive regulator
MAKAQSEFAVQPSPPGMKNTLERIEQKLAVLNPDSVELIDDSDKHAGHAGAKSGGGHFQLIIVSPLFSGKSTQARHRMVHAALGEMLEREIHALSIKAYTPDDL